MCYSRLLATFRCVGFPRGDESCSDPEGTSTIHKGRSKTPSIKHTSSGDELHWFSGKRGCVSSAGIGASWDQNTAVMVRLVSRKTRG